MCRRPRRMNTCHMTPMSSDYALHWFDAGVSDLFTFLYSSRKNPKGQQISYFHSHTDKPLPIQIVNRRLRLKLEKSVSVSQVPKGKNEKTKESSIQRRRGRVRFSSGQRSLGAPLSPGRLATIAIHGDARVYAKCRSKRWRRCEREQVDASLGTVPRPAAPTKHDCATAFSRLHGN